MFYNLPVQGTDIQYVGNCNRFRPISDPFEPCRMMLMCQEKGKVSDTEAYRTWNMGQGMLVVTDKPEKVIAAAGAYRIKAKITGVITKEKKLKIRSRGFFSGGSTLTF